MPTVFGYAVVLVGDGPSVEEQSERLRVMFDAHYAGRGFARGGITTDDAVSARQRFEDRDGAGRMLAKLKRDDVILVAQAGYAFCSLSDFAAGVGWLADVRGVSFHAGDIEGVLGPADKPGETRLAVVKWAAYLDHLLTSHRLREGHARRKGQPRRTGQTPFGFIFTGRGRGRHLVPNPAEREYGALLVDCRANGMGWGGIAKHFDKTGVRFRGKCPSVTSIRRHCAAEQGLRRQEAGGGNSNQIAPVAVAS